MLCLTVGILSNAFQEFANNEIQYSSTIQRDHEGWGIVAQKHILLQSQLNIYILKVGQHWLGIAKPKNVFRSILISSIK